MGTERHNAEILDQFTKQAEPFLQRHAHTNDALLESIFECSGVTEQDSVLDVACGPGIVSCFFARRARHVTGLDFVPAMLERARKLQSESQLTNLEWRLGQATGLPYADGAFDCVVTRFSFHHYIDPAAAFYEMKRVCRPGGTVLVADVTPTAQSQATFNAWEILRDPSHTRALTRTELEALGECAGMSLHRFADFRLGMKLEELLGGSFPKPGDADRIRSLFERDIENRRDSLGVAAHREDGAIKLFYPVTVLVWQKPN